MASWVLVDLLELIYLLRLEDASQFTFRILVSYAVRMVSILLIFIGTVIGWQTFPNFDITQIPQSAAFFFLLAAGFRLGVFPLNLPFLQEPGMRRGAGNILRLAPVASSLVLLARLPENIIPVEVRGWTWAFYALLAIAALYAAFRWLSATDEIEGRPFWIVAWASLAVASVLNGEPQASLAWGLALILPGSLFFLYFPRVQRMNFLLFFGLIGLVGLPYTPLASGWIGLVGNGVTLWTLIFLIAHAIMIFGTVNRALPTRRRSRCAGNLGADCISPGFHHHHSSHDHPGSGRLAGFIHPGDMVASSGKPGIGHRRSHSDPPVWD